MKWIAAIAAQSSMAIHWLSPYRLSTGERGKNAMAYPAPNVEEGSIVVEVVSLEGEKIALKVQRFRRCGELG